MSAHDRGDHHAQHQRHQDEARVRRGNAHNPLGKQGNVNDGAKEAHGGKQNGRHRGAEYPVVEQRQRQDRLLRPVLGEAERDRHHQGKGQQADDHRRGPFVFTAAPNQRQQQGHESQGQHHRAGVIDRPLFDVRDDPGHGPGDHAERQQPQGDVDVKYPPPADVIGDPAAAQRTGDAGDAEDAADESLPFAAFGRGEQVADHSDGLHHDGAAADALQAAKDDQLRHAVGQAAQHRADQEDDHARQVEAAAAVDIRKFAVDRDRDSGAEHVCGEHPAEMGKTVQVPDDLRHRRGDDGLIEGRQHRNVKHSAVI